MILNVGRSRLLRRLHFSLRSECSGQGKLDLLFFDVDCKPGSRDAVVVAVYDSVRAQDLQVLVLAVNFNRVL